MKTRRSAIATIVTCLALIAACSSREEPPPAGPAVPRPAPPSNCPSFAEASKGLPTEGEWKSFPAVGDVNGDGLADISALPRKMDGPRVFLSDGVGGWTDRSEAIRYQGGKFSCGIGTRLVDVNRDGATDLLAADHCLGIFVFHGDGKGGWTPASSGIPRNIQGFNDADAGDLDGDGLTDIVGVSAFASGFMVLAGQPDGSWLVRPDTGLPDAGHGWSVHIADMNLDGRPDLVTSFVPSALERRSVPPPPAKVWLQGNDGHFRPAEGFVDQGRFFGMATSKESGRKVPSVVAALSGAYGGIWLIRSEDGARWEREVRVDRGGFPEQGTMFVGLEVVDLDGDGCDDLLTTEGGSGKGWVAMGDCKGEWHFCAEGTLPQSEPLPPWGIRSADVNGDGRLDVVAAFGRGNVGGVKAWVQTKAGRPRAQPAP